MVTRYRHYENRGKAKDFVFATTTALDFAHILLRPEVKDVAARTIISVHQRYRAQLHAYAVMSNHLHIVSKMPALHDSPWFMQRLRDRLSKSILPLLQADELDLVSAQTELNRRSCWQASFDSIVLVKHAAFHQKIRYTHQNPVRAKLVERAQDYQWSSAAANTNGFWNPELGFDLDRLLDELS